MPLCELLFQSLAAFQQFRAQGIGVVIEAFRNAQWLIGRGKQDAIQLGGVRPTAGDDDAQCLRVAGYVEDQ